MNSLDSKSESQLCRKCHNFLGGMRFCETWAPAMTPFHNMLQLTESASSGCHLCSLILAEISPEKRRSYLQELRTIPDSENQFVTIVWKYDFQTQHTLQNKPIIQLSEARQRPGVSSRTTVCEFRCERLQDLPQLGRIVRRVQPSTRSWQTLNDIHYWLGECESNHLRCEARQKNTSRELPTRLLYVGAFDSDPQIYLRSAGKVSGKPLYATLSHRWGSNMSMKLQIANVEEFVGGIAIAKLPKTFRDAVGLTKTLGLDYLWIDSLCIIQDSKEDWAQECTRMSHIYAGSFVNLAASASTDPDGGLFSKRSSISVSPVILKLTYPPVRWQNTPVALYPDGDGSILRAPLTSRGWVAQERMLARRTIHFCDHKVIWECTEHFASESDVTGTLELPRAKDLNLPAMVAAYDAAHRPEKPRVQPLLMTAKDKEGYEIARPMLLTYQTPLSHPDRNTDGRDVFLYKWRDVVNLYSTCQLSIATDKLIAISGVARYMQTILWSGTQIKYYAGLWNYQFELQLTWSANRPTLRRRTDLPEVYIAPSWSWASHNGGVAYPTSSTSEPYTYWAELTHIKLYPLRDDFGALHSGLVRMRGPLCRAIVAEPNSAEEAMRRTGTSLTLLGSGIKIKLNALVLDDNNSIRPTSTGSEDRSCFVLFGIAKQAQDRERPLRGIVLQLTQSQPPRRGEYRRIGMFEANDPDAGEAEKIRKMLVGRPNAAVTPEKSFEGTDQQQRKDYAHLMAAFKAMDLPDAFYHGRRGTSYEFTII